MRQHSASTSRGSWPSGLIGLLLLVLAFELVVARRDRYATDLSESWGYKSRAARTAASTAEILCFGDSLVEFGVLPRVLEHRLGRRAYNLALHNGSPPAACFLLGRVLASGGKPSAIVVDFMPHQLAMNPAESSFESGWPKLAGAWEWLDLLGSTGDGRFAAKVLVAKCLPSFAVRAQLGLSLRAALEGRLHSGKQVVSVLRRHLNANLGAQVMPEVPQDSRQDPPPDQSLFPSTWITDPVSVRYARRFLAMAASREILVLWLVPPLSPEVEIARAGRPRRVLHPFRSTACGGVPECRRGRRPVLAVWGGPLRRSRPSEPPGRSGDDHRGRGHHRDFPRGSIPGTAMARLAELSRVRLAGRDRGFRCVQAGDPIPARHRAALSARLRAANDQAQLPLRDANAGDGAAVEGEVVFLDSVGEDHAILGHLRHDLERHAPSHLAEARVGG